MVMKNSTKASETSETINRLESVTDRSIAVIFKIALFAVSTSAINELLISRVKPDIKVWVIVLASMLATTVGLIYGFSILLTRRTLPTTALKKNVVKAYQQALDQSSFNPHPLNKQHEQLNK